MYYTTIENKINHIKSKNMDKVSRVVSIKYYVIAWPSGPRWISSKFLGVWSGGGRAGIQPKYADDLMMLLFHSQKVVIQSPGTEMKLGLEVSLQLFET